jgi:hypothetical protein
MWEQRNQMQFIVGKFLQMFIKKKNAPSLGCQLHDIYLC